MPFLRRALVHVVLALALPAALLSGAVATPAAATTAGASVGADRPQEATTQLVAGERHTCLLRDGDVRCWGSNENGQLGLGDTNHRGDAPARSVDDVPPVDLGSGRRAIAIAAGHWHTCAVLDTGAVVCWGANFSGNLGVGSTSHQGDNQGEMGDNLTTVPLGAGRRAQQLTAGTRHTCALLDDSRVKCWGYNAMGALGIGASDTRGDAPGELGNALPAVDLGTGRTARQIVSGDEHVCALLDNSKVKCWGMNSYGQAGLGRTGDVGTGSGQMGDDLPFVDLGTGRTVRSLAAGGYHTCAILDTHAVKCWGYGPYGQLGLGDTGMRGDAPGEMGDALPAVDLGTDRTARQITAGAYHSCAILDDGTARCWGYNQYGQLGLGDTTTRGDEPGEMGDALPPVDLGTDRTAVQMTAGYAHTCVLLDDGDVRCWGYNDRGQLGADDTVQRGDAPGEMGDALPAAARAAGRTAVAPTAGWTSTCAILANGALTCWGNNDTGQLGLGDTAARGGAAGEMGDALPTVQLGTGRTVRQMDIAMRHACAVLDDSSVKCWGLNDTGQLGRGDTSTRGDEPGEMGDVLPAVDLGTGRTVVEVAAAHNHTCAILDNGAVRCWGFNGSGQLGVGDMTWRGQGPGQMGDALPIADLGTGRTARRLATTAFSTCALLDDSTVKCWGANADGELGLGDTNHRGNEPGEMGDALPAVPLGSGRTVRQIAAGHDHVCALLDDGTVKCWGQNGSGQLGRGDTSTRGDEPGEMGDALAVVDLGAGRTARDLAAGGSFTCALLDDGTVKCWGENDAGQLGLGDTSNRGDAPGEMGDALATVDLGTGAVLGLTAGERHACALLSGGRMKCWGLNAPGRLGLGDSVTRGNDADEMGDLLPVVDLADPPVVTITAPLGTSATRAATFVVAAGETFHGLTADDLATTGTATGCTATPDASSGTSITVQVACATDGSVALRLRPRRLVDASGNAVPPQPLASAAAQLVDAPPTVTITAPASPTEVTSLTYVVHLSEAITGLAADDFVVRGTAPGCTTSLPWTNGQTAMVVVTCDGPGTVLLSMVPGSVTDVVGNTGPPAETPASAVVIGAPRTFASVTPARLLDTRSGLGGVVPGRVGSAGGNAAPLTFRVAGRGEVPATGVAAVSLNLTVVEPSTDGYASVYPCGALPSTSSVNFAAGRTTANAVTTPLSGTGDFCVHVFGDAHVIADITGWLAEDKGFTSVDPARLFDTRSGLGGVPAARIGRTDGTFTPLVFRATERAGIPATGVAAVSVNLTVVGPSTDGYATVYPCGTVPNTSNVNFLAGVTTAAAAVVPLSAQGELCVAVFGNADVLLDVNGWFATGSGLSTVTPARLLDTRSGLGGVPVARLGRTDGTFAPLRFRAAGAGGVPGTGAGAISATITAVDPSTDGYATIYPCGTRPDTSTVNFATGRTTANAVTTPLSAGGEFCVAVFGNADVLVDVNGWFAS